MSARVDLLLYADHPLRLPELDGEGARARPALAPPRPGDDTRLHGDDPRATAHVASAPHAAALSFHGDDLDALQTAAADAVDAAAALTSAGALASGTAGGTITVVDVIALDARDALSASARLRACDPSSRLWIGIRPEHGDAPPPGQEVYRVETFGLRKLHQPEIHVRQVPEAELGAVAQFLNKLFDYAATTGARLGPDDRVSFGWVDVQLRPLPLGPPRFIAEALAEPDLPGVLTPYEPTHDGDDAPLTPGARRAAQLMNQLLEGCHRCGITSGILVPRAAATAVACRRLPEAATVHARRTPPDDPTASGWVFVCADADHDHDDPDNFAVVPLRDVCLCAPRLFPMLAAPIGTGLTTNDREELIIDLPEA